MYLRQRRRVLRALAGAVRVAPLAARSQGEPLVGVWKSPRCSCCKFRVAHLEANGLAVKVNEVGNTGLRGRLGIPAPLGSCRTALVGGYAIEGHLPARDIQRLPAECVQAVGLAVPGMPVGSPGMGGPEHGGRRDRYDVLLLRKDGSTAVLASHA